MREVAVMVVVVPVVSSGPSSQWPLPPPPCLYFDLMQPPIPSILDARLRLH